MKSGYSRFFQQETDNIIRVADFLDKNDKENFKATINLYDKKMSTVLACMQYEAALKQADQFDEEKLDVLRNGMHKIIDEAYEGFSKSIIQGKKYESIRQHLDNLKTEIEEIKKDKIISRQIIEVACLKLAIMHDFAHDDMSMCITVNVAIGSLDRPGIINIPTRDTQKFKSNLRLMRLDYPDNNGNMEINRNNILPIYSRSVTVGFNTILFAIFNDYYPVGFGEQPFSIHAGVYLNHCLYTSQHEYRHALMRVKFVKQSEIYADYKNTYKKIFEDRKHNKLDDVTFRKDC